MAPARGSTSPHSLPRESKSWETNSISSYPDPPPHPQPRVLARRQALPLLRTAMARGKEERKARRNRGPGRTADRALPAVQPEGPSAVLRGASVERGAAARDEAWVSAPVRRERTGPAAASSRRDRRWYAKGA